MRTSDASSRISARRIERAAEPASSATSPSRPRPASRGVSHRPMKIGIDLGTANILVYVQGKGIVIQEPSVVAVDDQNRIVAVGEDAREMIGRTPGNIQAIRPMKDGVIADYVITEAMLSHFIGKVKQGSIGFTKPDVMISVPAGVTSRREARGPRRRAQGGRPGGLPHRGAAGRRDRGQRADRRAVRQHGHRHRWRDERDRGDRPRRHRRLDQPAGRRQQVRRGDRDVHPQEVQPDGRRPDGRGGQDRDRDGAAARARAAAWRSADAT